MDHLEKQQRKVHPKDSDGFISNIFFLYAIKLFKKGFGKELEDGDLYEVPREYRSKQLGDQLEEQWEKQKKKSVVRLLLSCYGFYYLLLGFMQALMNVVVIVIQPHALGKLIAFFAPGQTELTRKDAYYYAALVLGLNFVDCVYKHNYYLLLTTFGIKVRTAFCSFMYRKVLKLSPAHMGDVSIGKIVTLITKDVDTFEPFIDFGNDVWIGFLKTFIVAASLYSRIGLSAVAGVGFFLVIMPLQIYLGAKVTSMKLQMCKKTDDRLQLTQESLSAIRIIKMYTWEKIFDDRISNARKAEVHMTFKMSALRFMIIASGSLTSQIAFYLMVISYVWLGNVVTAEIVFFMLTTFQELSFGMSILFPIGIYQTAELKSAIKRIDQILKATEIEIGKPTVIAAVPRINFNNVTVSVKNHDILKNIDFNIEKGLTVVTGPVGSGKSFLLKTILGDYNPVGGNLVVQGTISYASQEPWLFPSSIKQNILFGQPYDEKRYNEVLKVCALIYDLELLESGDNTIVEDRGINLSKGQQARINLARAVYKLSDIYLLDDSLAALDGNVSSFIFKECILDFLKDKIVLLVSHDVKCAKSADTTVVMQNGCIKKLGKLTELSENKIVHNEAKKKLEVFEEDEDEAANEDSNLLAKATTQRKVFHEEKNSGDVSGAVYKKYVQFGGGFFVMGLVFCTFVTAQFVISYTDKMVSDWVNLEEKISNNSFSNSTNSTIDHELRQQRTNMFYLYTFMTIATTATIIGRAVAHYLFARAASIKLHKQMISTIINATMRFFDTNFIGNILNRFSKDLITVDEYIPFAVFHVVAIFLQLVGIVSLIVSVSVMFLIPTVLFLAILLVLRWCCLRTSRSLKRLDAATRSPVVGYINASLEGLTTIRAFKAERVLRDEFDRHQDLYTSASYSLQSCMTAFSFIMDTLCGFFISFIVVRFLMTDNDVLAGQVGLAISQAFNLVGNLEFGIRQWAEIENRMTSVERVLEYADIQKENQQGLEPQHQTKLGEVTYQNVFLTYTNSTEYVLKNINFTVKPGEKIGIVGRTGAGKSSIISTLFRLYDVEGKITIDGVDTKILSLSHLRANISIIPQDPVLFTGSVRHNIDPSNKYSDDKIWKAIKASHLDNLIPSLDFQIVEAGANFSIGQRQLICMARAIVQDNKIVVMDEATANMDPETEELIFQTIRENFRNCTVITIAHKLKSILKSDKVMVMDKGEIVEFDGPENLAQDNDGVFYGMLAKAGLLGTSK